MPGRPGRAEPAADRHRRSRRAWWSSGWRPRWTRACWWWSRGCARRCGSATTASARRSWPGWTRSGGARCSWRWRGGWPSVPELFAVAAEQYLPVVDAVDDAAERRRVVGLLRRAADQAGLIGDYALVNALLAAALRLIDPGETRHAGRGAHRPPRRAVQPGAAGRGGRGVPHDRAAVSHRGASARTRRRCRCAA